LRANKTHYSGVWQDAKMKVDLTSFMSWLYGQNREVFNFKPETRPVPPVSPLFLVLISFWS
jgi:hypothetical protein